MVLLSLQRCDRWWCHYRGVTEVVLLSLQKCDRGAVIVITEV